MRRALGSDRAVKRLKGLLRQLTDEHGSYEAVGRLLGVSGNVVGKTIDDERGHGRLSAHWLLVAWLKLGLPIDYFTRDGDETLDYREYRRGDVTSTDLAAIQRRLDALEADRLRADSEESRTRRKA